MVIDVGQGQNERESSMGAVPGFFKLDCTAQLLCTVHAHWA